MNAAANPYQPPTIGSVNASPRWWLRFALLNALLLAVPVVLVVAAIGSMRIQLAVENYGIADDPVTYQHTIWISGPTSIWPLLTYLLAPNLAMLVAFARFRFRKTERTQSAD